MELRSDGSPYECEGIKYYLLTLEQNCVIDTAGRHVVIPIAREQLGISICDERHNNEERDEKE